MHRNGERLMDQEMEAPIDDLEALFAVEDEELFGRVEPPTEIEEYCS